MAQGSSKRSKNEIADALAGVRSALFGVGAFSALINAVLTGPPDATLGVGKIQELEIDWTQGVW